MKSGGVSLEFYMFPCDWNLALLKDIKNIDIIQRSVIIVLIKLKWRYCLILYLHMIQIYSSPRHSVKRGSNTS